LKIERLIRESHKAQGQRPDDEMKETCFYPERIYHKIQIQISGGKRKEGFDIAEGRQSIIKLSKKSFSPQSALKLSGNLKAGFPSA
jgi:hypothetical protein